jgi:EAL domain-containing protein (putative c-di-GMP-specific phosphodiesterase class I)
MSDPNGKTADLSGLWFLEGHVDDGERRWRVPITTQPFFVGRRPGLGLTLLSDAVSGLHARLYENETGWRVQDLSSTNGTFLNRRRVTDAPIQEGDVLHFADLEFRIGREDVEDSATSGATLTVPLADLDLPRRFAETGQHLMRLLRQGLVTLHFQPIIGLRDGAVLGHEALGRGRLPELPAEPSDLFLVASSLGVEVQLSRLFRNKLRDFKDAGPKLGMVFLNTHPSELEDAETVESLGRLQEDVAPIPITLEVHERFAASSPAFVAGLRKQLREMGIGLAYDDFGVGQSRLVELTDSPPDYLKFDISLIRGIDQAPSSRQRVLASLVSAASDLGVGTIAEGVETAAEAATCAAIGFSHAQGFHFRRPRPGEEFAGRTLPPPPPSSS